MLRRLKTSEINKLSESVPRDTRLKVYTTGVEAMKIIKRRHADYYKSPAVGLCDCGCKVELPDFTNTCPRCKTDYNSSGQQLASREQWGEETGESLADILSVK